MTEEKLGAGLELDLKMYRLVYGYDAPNLGSSVRGGKIYTHCSDGGFEKEFSPSTRIEDAWLVLEKMRERGLYVGFDSNAASPDVWRFWAQDEEGEYVASGEAPTAPLAACKMALACLAAAGEKGGG